MSYVLGQQLTIEEYYDAAQWIKDNAPELDILNIGDKLYEIIQKVPETEEQIKERRIADLHAFLAGTDYINDKIHEAEIYGTPEHVAALVEKYRQTAAERAEARAELDELEK